MISQNAAINGMFIISFVCIVHRFDVAYTRRRMVLKETGVIIAIAGLVLFARWLFKKSFGRWNEHGKDRRP